jgi:hypothetical protein
MVLETLEDDPILAIAKIRGCCFRMNTSNQEIYIQM